MKKPLTCLTLCAMTLFCTPSLYGQDALPAYKNTQLSFNQRAKDLVSRMTTQEKIGQMITDAEAIPRLEVPAYRWWSECLHGVARNGNASMFPMPIGLAATFNSTLVHDVASAISDEGRVLFRWAQERGNQSKYTGLTYFSPSINIFRDPRWGRGQETYGEDPFLTGRLGVAYVKGLQGDDKKYLKTTACAKHFAAYSGFDDPKVMNTTATQSDLLQTYLPAFKCLVQEGKVASVMGAYNQINGLPSSGNKALLTNLLRKQWGFKGWVTSDCGALNRFISVMKICKTPEEAAAMAANAGLNLNCGKLYYNGLQKAIDKGLLKEATMDSLLVDLMQTRFELGLFDDPKEVPYMQLADSVVDSKSHRALAYKAALQSYVLLKNKEHTLPLGKKTNYVYITGVHANNPNALIGNYYGMNSKITTFAQGIAERMPKGMSLQYRPGVLLVQEAYNKWTTKEAPEADAVVACLGLTNELEGEGMDAIALNNAGELYNLSIPKAQLNFLRELHANTAAKHKKLIVVLTGGAPVLLDEIKDLCDALIYTWYGGEEGGTALADILFGKASPSGHTPMTFVKSLDQLPDFASYAMTGRTYRYMTQKPLYPFGYGLSYSTFAYTQLQYVHQLKAGEDLPISVQIKNTGEMAADEVVQLYVSLDQTKGESTPIRQLCAFKRIHLAKGETQKVTLTLPAHFMAYLVKDQKGNFARKVLPGALRFSIGNGQPVAQTANYLEGTFTIKGEAAIQ